MNWYEDGSVRGERESLGNLGEQDILHGLSEYTSRFTKGLEGEGRWSRRQGGARGTNVDGENDH